MIKNKIIWEREYVKICCNKGYVLVDPCSLTKLPNRTVCIHSSFKYAYFKFNGKQIKLHRYLMNLTDPKVQVDHINRDPLDNRMSNLRIASNAENCRNRNNRKNSKIKYKGVTQTKEGNYMARIQVDGKRICLGRFESPEKAAEVYNKYAEHLHKEFAKLNKVDT